MMKVKMTQKQLLEIYKLLNLSDRSFNRHLLMGQEASFEQFKISNRIQKKNLINDVLNNYYLQTQPYIEKLKEVGETTCKIYCLFRKFSIDELNELCEILITSLEIAADPILISFIIRYILKKICQCERRAKNCNKMKVKRIIKFKGRFVCVR